MIYNEVGNKASMRILLNRAVSECTQANMCAHLVANDSPQNACLVYNPARDRII